ncbi:hypothetical protein ASG31_15085 [Chryseobacterium sp. Leaf404]|uniref:glycosyltransferase family 2 protein n=1 Tax=unclassified Chryseobacterium TaxID=2593645 RepID=UPI000701FCC0|nr:MULTISPECIES: glycosyltransferase family 2 protein [unclassified Chryseobacterium]KQT15253.1 hypothetical protein ASG31_15085 [Chryseobacterium sp. Leaf404]
MILSIITINYNNKNGLAKTVQSIGSQSRRAFEYIVIDGNSSDGSKNIIENNSEFINLWVSEPDSGVYNAMNKGIKMASGDYLLFLNSGDVLADDQVIENVLPLLDNHSDIISGNMIYSLNGISQTIFTPPENISLVYFLRSFLPHPSSFIRKNLFDKVGFYSENFKIVSDWEFFLKAIVIHQAKYKNINLTVSDFDNSGISSNHSNKVLMKNEKQAVYQKYFPNLQNEIILLDFAGSRRMQQIENIHSNHPFLWKLLKFWLNILNLFVSKKEVRSCKKIRN